MRLRRRSGNSRHLELENPTLVDGALDDMPDVGGLGHVAGVGQGLKLLSLGATDTRSHDARFLDRLFVRHDLASVLTLLPHAVVLMVVM